MPAKGKGRGKAAAGHQLASALPQGTEMKDLRKKSWFVGEPIGSGGFGLIYLADEKKTSTGKDKAEYVIKVEPHGNGPLYCEVAFYQRAAKPESLAAWKKSSRLPYVGIPAYIAHGLHANGSEDLRFMVMPRFGRDLHNLWIESNKRFSRETVCQIAVQLINSLEYMHASEYVHADVKGANILLGHKDSNQIFLVDFGLAYRYIADGKHKEYREDPKKAHDGTIEYTSIDAHMGVAPSRRSDLEILGYVLLHWLSGRLPWEDNLSNKNYVKEQKIKHMKKVKDFVSSVYPEAKTQKGNEIEKFLQDVSKLGYDEQPNYDLLRKYFQDALKSMGIPLKSKISFQPQGSSTKATKAKRSVAKKTKPLTSVTNSQSSQSDDEGEVVPKKRARKTSAKRKQVITSSSEDLSTANSSSASEATPVKNKKASSSTKRAPLKRGRKQIKQALPETSSDEQIDSEYSTSTDDTFKKPSNSRHPSRKRRSNTSTEDEPSRKRRSKTSTEDEPSPSLITEDEEVNVIDSTFDSASPVRMATRSSPAQVKTPDKNKQNKAAISKSRYSMAPLHTKSVLAKDDRLSGKHSGKHPVIIRKRKVKRPKTDAVTQTTPSLKKQVSRV